MTWTKRRVTGRSTVKSAAASAFPLPSGRILKSVSVIIVRLCVARSCQHLLFDGSLADAALHGCRYQVGTAFASWRSDNESALNGVNEWDAPTIIHEEAMKLLRPQEFRAGSVVEGTPLRR